VEEEFEDRGSRFDEQRLEIADMLIAVGAGFLINELVDACDQHILVV
jgi:hypothetical protein